MTHALTSGGRGRPTPHAILSAWPRVRGSGTVVMPVVCHGALAGGRFGKPGASPFGLADCQAGGHRACARLGRIASLSTRRSAHDGTRITISLSSNDPFITADIKSSTTSAAGLLFFYRYYRSGTAFHPSRAALNIIVLWLPLGPASKHEDHRSAVIVGTQLQQWPSTAAYIEYHNDLTGEPKCHS